MPVVEVGLVDDGRWAAFNRKREAVARLDQQLKSTWVHPQVLQPADAERLLGKAIEHEHSLTDLLRRPGIDFDRVAEVGAVAAANRLGSTQTVTVSRETLISELGQGLATVVIEQVEIATKYAGYIGKQVDEVERAAHFEHLKLPPDLDYQLVKALSHEVRQKLGRHRPETLGQASRMSGVTPAAVSLLLVHLKKGRFAGFSEGAVGHRIGGIRALGDDVAALVETADASNPSVGSAGDGSIPSIPSAAQAQDAV